MSLEEQQEFGFSIRSGSQAIATPEYLEQIGEALEELQRLQPAGLQVKQVRIDKEKTYPVDSHTIVFIITIVFGSEFTKELLKKAADDVYAWLKGRWKSAHIEPTDPPKIAG
jgi:hypothetical protein